ncbi:MAG: hypothetical protein HQL61_00540 [Magnetococcales bacterium]|nr:hypothetical protein [Nitrospirota bacterium]
MIEESFKKNEDSTESEFGIIPLPCADTAKGPNCFKSSLEFLIAHKSFNCECIPDGCNYDYYYIRLRVLQKLVSGLLDLDRIDHYLRDSFFTGVKLANFNIEYLLHGMKFKTYKNESGKEDFDLCLSKDALIHAKGLLYSKEQINDAIFENPELISYEIILNKCITEYIKDKGKDKAIEQIYKMEDWRLLDELEKFGTKEKSHNSNRKVGDLFKRLKTKKSLHFIGKFTLKGNYYVDFCADKNSYLDYKYDLKLVEALENLYKFILGFDIKNSDLNDDILSENILTKFIRDEIYYKYNLFIEKDLGIDTSDKYSAIKHTMKYLLFVDVEKANDEFIEKRKRLYEKIGDRAKRILFNEVKREFIRKINSKIEDNPIEFYVKFSKKFLDFYELSHDVVDLSKIVISDSAKRVGEDYSEKEFLRMFAGRDIKSRNNLWLYATNEKNQEKDKIIQKLLKTLDKCGLDCTRSTY